MVSLDDSAIPIVIVSGLPERKRAQFALNPLALCSGLFISRLDVIVNVLLFVPFGIWTVRILARRMTVAVRILLVCVVGRRTDPPSSRSRPCVTIRSSSGRGSAW